MYMHITFAQGLRMYCFLFIEGLFQTHTPTHSLFLTLSSPLFPYPLFWLQRIIQDRIKKQYINSIFTCCLYTEALLINFRHSHWTASISLPCRAFCNLKSYFLSCFTHVYALLSYLNSDVFSISHRNHTFLLLI